MAETKRVPVKRRTAGQPFRSLGVDAMGRLIFDDAPGFNDTDADELISRRFSELAIPLLTTKDQQYAIGNASIFDYTDLAHPGHEIIVEGKFSATAILCLSVAESLRYYELPIVSQESGLIKAIIPVSVPLNVYKIFVVDGTGRSPVSYINRARLDSVNSSVMYSGCKLSIKGKNLMLGDKKPKVKFVHSSGTVLPGFFVPTGSNAYCINATAPTELVVGETYTIKVTNGWGNYETALKTTVQAIAPAVDVHGLGVGSSALFTDAMNANTYNVKDDPRLNNTFAAGNGTGDDNWPIQNAINKASLAGGGIVDLPAGTYRLEGGLQARSNVVLRGVGKDLTKVVFDITNPGPGSGGFFLPVGQSFGLANMTIEDVGVTLPDGSSSTRNYFGCALKGQNFFMKGVRAIMNESDWYTFEKAKHVTILDSEFDQRTNRSIHGPINVQESEYVTVKHNTFTFVAGPSFSDNQYLFIDDNSFIRDISKPIVNDSVIHLLVTEFISDSIIQNNRFLVKDGPIPRGTNVGGARKNDGESIVGEGGGEGVRDLFYGDVVSATAGSVTVDDGNFSTTITHKPYVQIVTGKGQGQLRRVIGRTTDTLQLETAWDEIPDETSRIATFNLGYKRVALVNNIFEDNQRGIVLYHNPMYEVDIVGNRLKNSGSIGVTTYQGIRNDGTKQLITVSKIDIIGNYVDSRTDPWNGGSIGFHCVQNINPKTIGPHVRVSQMRNNVLINAPENKPVIMDKLLPATYSAFCDFEVTDQQFQDEGIPVLRGVTIQDNVAVNCASSVTVSTATHHVSILNMEQIGSPVLVNDVRIGGNAGSRFTVTI